MANGKVPKDVKYLLRHGSNYPCAILLSDGAIICTQCARQEYKQLAYSARHRLNDGWNPVAAIPEIHPEDCDEICCHCNEIIASAD